MIRRTPPAICATAIAVSLLLLSPSIAATAHIKRHHARAWHGYGFLPGYRPPETIQYQRAYDHGPHWWYGYPGFYRGRWNGGGFGPCWTQTPIGEIWNCGK